MLLLEVLKNKNSIPCFRVYKIWKPCSLVSGICFSCFRVYRKYISTYWVLPHIITSMYISCVRKTSTGIFRYIITCIRVYIGIVIFIMFLGLGARGLVAISGLTARRVRIGELTRDQGSSFVLEADPLLAPLFVS